MKIAVIGVCPSLVKSMAIARAIRQVIGCPATVIGSDGMAGGVLVCPGDGCANLDGIGSRVELKAADVDLHLIA